MKTVPGALAVRASILFCGVTIAFAQTAPDTAAEVAKLLDKGKAELTENRFRDAAEAFQSAVDLDPSSARAHEGLGIALSSYLIAGNLHPSTDSDILERAENHLRQASDLSPSSLPALSHWADLETALAERSSDPDERATRYQQAQDLLKREISIDPGRAGVYLRLARLERDQFSQPLQDANARFEKNKGPIPDKKLRRRLQEQFAALIDDAIANAQTACQLNVKSAPLLLLTSRLLRDRALIRDTAEQAQTDLQSAESWERQFLAVGGHLGDRQTTAH